MRVMDDKTNTISEGKKKERSTRKLRSLEKLKTQETAL
jgi:hypothetical protein